MKKRDSKLTFRVAFCGLLCALGLVFMLLSSVISIMTYVGPIFASILLIAVMVECDARAAFMTYAATGILAALLIADKEAAFFYIAVGYYPVIKPYFDKIKPKAARIAAKFAYFAVVLGILYAILIAVLGLDAVMGSLGKYKYLETVGFVLILVIIMLMFDNLIDKYKVLYEKRIHPRLKFLGRVGAFLLAAGALMFAKGDTAYANTKAVTYFGDEWAINFLNSEHSQADADFARIRNDGFNAVIFCVPWREIQPTFGRAYNDAAIAKLDELMNKANAAGLQVMFRLGYTWDYADNGNVLDRYNKVFSDSSVKSSWLSYAGKMYAVGSAHSNFKGAFITWEDFWPSLSSVYSGDFAKMDNALLKLLADTQTAFPNISMECRLDEDMRGGTRYSHSATFGCANSSYTSAMMSVSMGWESNQTVSASAAVQNSSGIIGKMQAAGKPVFIDQFLYMETTPGYENLAKVSDVNGYLAGMGSVFMNQTMGYGIWTYRDYADNIIYNPEFGLDLNGWASGSGVSVEVVNGSKMACLEPGASITQSTSGRGFLSSKSSKAQVSVVADEPGQLTVTVEGVAKTLSFPAGQTTLKFDYGKNVKGSISITSSVKAHIDNVKLYSHITEGNVYNLDGSAGDYLAGIRAMNSKN